MLVLAWLTLRKWSWRRYVPPKCHVTFTGLHGVISQKIELFVATAVRTTNPATRYTYLQAIDVYGIWTLNILRDLLQFRLSCAGVLKFIEFSTGIALVRTLFWTLYLHIDCDWYIWCSRKVSLSFVQRISWTAKLLCSHCSGRSQSAYICRLLFSIPLDTIYIVVFEAI
jgi:hypothetical protein